MRNPRIKELAYATVNSTGKRHLHCGFLKLSLGGVLLMLSTVAKTFQSQLSRQDPD